MTGTLTISMRNDNQINERNLKKLRYLSVNYTVDEKNYVVTSFHAYLILTVCTRDLNQKTSLKDLTNNNFT